MAVTEKPKVFETTDGREFKSRIEAERHQTAVDAVSAFEAARSRVLKALSQEMRTADGKLFDLNRWSCYYEICKPHQRLPFLREVRVSFMACELELREDRVIVVGLREPDGKGISERVRFIEVRELFDSNSAAKAALKLAREEFIAECQRAGND